ncbi:MAG: UDP-N-acetylmuramoyl-tripeptide--D-alanyl-D-alanine ligase, partial [Gemmatimonadota bacterium]|nr:UDP-N-acetylmuramoyl-tripeptide--D-alanyl-D-alanine ligase [Gemmatimonadota bacterium]
MTSALSNGKPMSLSTGDVLSAIAGAELAGSRAAVSYGEFFTDTRKPCRGGMFVAISGERYDGNRFLQEAADAGAAGAIIGSSAPEDTLLPEGLQCFRVADTLAALQDLAAWHRHLCTRVRVVGITGSNGKSTTKQLTLSVCSKAFTTQATAGNLNNHIGVPLTLLGLDPDTELMITEMAANHPGEIRCLASLARPVVSLITNIMPTHLEGFSSLEGILQAKLELFEQTGSQGTLIFNGDDELLRGAVGRFSQEKITFGLGHTNQVKPFEVILAGAARYSFTLRPGSRHIHLPVPGRHNIYNALAAAAVGRALGIADEEIAAGIEHASGLKMRME